MPSSYTQPEGDVRDGLPQPEPRDRPGSVEKGRRGSRGLIVDGKYTKTEEVQERCADFHTTIASAKIGYWLLM